MSSKNTQHLDLALLPVRQKENLCRLLDQRDKWEELGLLMQFSEFDVDNVRTDAVRLRRSPADVLITRWSSLYGHNVTELFKLLSLMNHYQAMDMIKDLVDKRYHVWYNSTQRSNDSEGKKLNVGAKSQIFREDPKKENLKKEEIEENLKELLNIPEIPVEELKNATNNWAEENVLGRGGFGVVYKGEWISTQVAVKKLEYRESRSGSSREHWTQSLNELRYLNHCRHDNILPIYGYAIEGDICLVVYKLMPGGSLEDRLGKRSGFEPLTWPLRWNIAKGTARGLQYLHRFSEKPLIHSDIKPANILLDSCCEPMIGDFGLSREGHVHDQCMEVSRVFGTRPYLPQEFLKHSLLSTKVDVFSFGVLLFELASGLKSHDKHRTNYPFLYDYMARKNENSRSVIQRIIDPSTPNDEACLELCRLMVSLGKVCTHVNPNYRPEMMSVLKALESFDPMIPVNNEFLN